LEADKLNRVAEFLVGLDLGSSVHLDKRRLGTAHHLLRLVENMLQSLSQAPEILQPVFNESTKAVPERLYKRIHNSCCDGKD
jgi:hypothetical protein